MTKQKDTPKDLPKVDPKILRQLARSMVAADLEKGSDAATRKTAWESHKKDALKKARNVTRRLAAAGITLTKA